MSKPLDKLKSGSLGQRVEAIKQITALFWLERIVYLSVITISLALLLAGATLALIKGNLVGVRAAVTEGSGGVCVTASVFLLRMWNRALNLALNSEVKGDE